MAVAHHPHPDLLYLSLSFVLPGVAEGSAPPAAVRASLSSPIKPQLRRAHGLNGMALQMAPPGASALPASLSPGRLRLSPQATPQGHSRAPRQRLAAQACCSPPPADRAGSAAAARQCQGQDTCAAGPAAGSLPGQSVTAAASCHQGQDGWAADPAPGTLAAPPECHQGETHERSQTTPLKRLLGFLGFGTPSGSRDSHTKGQPPPLKRARLAPSWVAKAVGRPTQSAQSILAAASPSSNMAVEPARSLGFSTSAASPVQESQEILSSLQPTELSPRQLQDLAALTSLLAAHGSPGTAAGSPKHLQQKPEAQGSSPCTVAVAAAGARVAEALMSKEWSMGSQPRQAQAAEPDAVGHWAAALAAMDASPASISSGMVLRAEAPAQAEAAADQPDSLQPGTQAGTVCAGQDASSQAAAAALPVKSVLSQSGGPEHHGHAGLDIGSQTSDAHDTGSLGGAVRQVSRTSAGLRGKQIAAEAEAADGPGSTGAAAGPSTETEMQIQCPAEVISPSRRFRKFRRLRAKPGSLGLVFVRQ